MHWLCSACARNHLHVRRNGICPVCRQPVKFTKKLVRPARQLEERARGVVAEPNICRPAEVSMDDGSSSMQHEPNGDGDEAMPIVIDDQAELQRR